MAVDYADLTLRKYALNLNVCLSRMLLILNYKHSNFSFSYRKDSSSHYTLTLWQHFHLWDKLDSPSVSASLFFVTFSRKKQLDQFVSDICEHFRSRTNVGVEFVSPWEKIKIRLPLGGFRVLDNEYTRPFILQYSVV